MSVLGESSDIDIRYVSVASGASLGEASQGGVAQ